MDKSPCPQETLGEARRVKRSQSHKQLSITTEIKTMKKVTSGLQ